MHDYKDTDKLSQTVKVAKAALLVYRRAIYPVSRLGYLKPPCYVNSDHYLLSLLMFPYVLCYEWC